MSRYRETAEYAIGKAKQMGADMAQCVASEAAAEEFNIDSGQFSLMRTMFSDTFQVKVIKDARKGTATLGELSKEAADRALKEALAAAEAAEPDECEGIAEISERRVFKEGPMAPLRDLFFTRLENFLTDVSKEFPKVMLEQVVAAHKAGRTVFLNTNGVDFEYEAGRYDVSASFSAREGGLTSSFNGYGFRDNNLRERFIDLGQFRTLFSESERQIHTRQAEGKFVGPVILSPGCLCEFLMTALSNFASDAPLIDGTAIWKDALGAAMADPRLTLKSIPLDARIACGERFTADGYPAEDVTFIENGVLKSFFLTRYGSKRTGLPRSKSLSMNFELLPGDISLSDMVKGVKRGLLVGRFSGGQPGAAGDFSGVAKNSFLIENGEITDAVSETMISGNIADMLKNLIAVSSETFLDGVTVMPYAAFDGVTISGK